MQLVREKRDFKSSRHIFQMLGSATRRAGYGWHDADRGRGSTVCSGDQMKKVIKPEGQEQVESSFIRSTEVETDSCWVSVLAPTNSSDDFAHTRFSPASTATSLLVTRPTCCWCHRRTSPYGSSSCSNPICWVFLGRVQVTVSLETKLWIVNSVHMLHIWCRLPELGSMARVQPPLPLWMRPPGGHSPPHCPKHPLHAVGMESERARHALRPPQSDNDHQQKIQPWHTENMDANFLHASNLIIHPSIHSFMHWFSNL